MGTCFCRGLQLFFPSVRVSAGTSSVRISVGTSTATRVRVSVGTSTLPSVRFSVGTSTLPTVDTLFSSVFLPHHRYVFFVGTPTLLPAPISIDIPSLPSARVFVGSRTSHHRYAFPWVLLSHHRYVLFRRYFHITTATCFCRYFHLQYVFLSVLYIFINIITAFLVAWAVSPIAPSVCIFVDTSTIPSTRTFRHVFPSIFLFRHRYGVFRRFEPLSWTGWWAESTSSWQGGTATPPSTKC